MFLFLEERGPNNFPVNKRKNQKTYKGERYMNIKYLKVLIAVMAAVLLTSMSVRAAEPVKSRPDIRKISGEIAWIDVKLGKLQLNIDAGQYMSGTAEYRINQDQTRVTDPTDKKFLVIKDLRAGQHVTIEFINGPGEIIAQKIIAEPMLEPVFQVVTGELESIDVQAGTLVIEQRPVPNEGGKGDLYDFVFEPRSIVVMKSPSMQPVELVLRPGDIVKVEFIVRDGKRHARSITLLSAAPDTTSTTTTTTTRTTVTQ